MSFKHQQQLQVLALLLLGLLIGVRYGSSLAASFNQPRYPFFGAIDFVEYWSAHRLAARGADPYDPAGMLELQSAIRPSAEPLMMWNPPWILPLLAPLLSLDFTDAVRGWLVINLALVLALPLVLGAAFEFRAGEKLLLLLLALTFPAFWFSAAHGQLGIVLAFFVSLAFCLLRRGHSFAAGLALSLLTLKLHLIYLVLIALLCCEVRRRSFSLLLGMIAGTGLQILSCQLIFPGTLYAWLRVMTHQSELSGATRITQWYAATLPGALAAWFSAAGSQFWARLIKLIPAFVALICANHLLFRSKVRRRIEMLYLFLPLSICTAPFGWFFDQALLFPVCALIVIAARRFQAGYGLWLTLYLTLVGWYGLYQLQQHQQAFWFPAGIVLLTWLAQPLTRTFWSESAPIVVDHDR